MHNRHARLARRGELEETEDLTSYERDEIRHSLLASMIHRRTFAYYLAPFEEAWRRLFESRPSLIEVELVAHAVDEGILGSFLCSRSDIGRSSSIFGVRSQELLEKFAPCYEDWEWEDERVQGLLSRPPLFTQPPDFVPAFTLDRFFTRNA